MIPLASARLARSPAMAPNGSQVPGGLIPGRLRYQRAGERVCAEIEVGQLDLGIVMVVAVATVAGSLLADIGYAVLDPWVRYVSS
jgi:hypothetical protein